jgi:hypothetical protein
MINPVINVNDKRLTTSERHLLRTIACRLAGMQPRRQQQLIDDTFAAPEGTLRAVDVQEDA